MSAIKDNLYNIVPLVQIGPKRDALHDWNKSMYGDMIELLEVSKNMSLYMLDREYTCYMYNVCSNMKR